MTEVPEFTELPALEQARIFKDRLRGAESTLAVEVANEAAGDETATPRREKAEETVANLRDLVAAAEDRNESARVELGEAPAPKANTTGSKE